MTDRFTYDAGPYVLGALPPEDRRAFEEHLATCAQCQAEVREFAGLPGLLSRLPAGELPAVLQGAPEPPGPVSVLPALLREAGVERRSRRRRTLLVGIAATLAVAAGSAAVTDAVAGGSAPVVAQAPQPQVLHFVPFQAGIPVTADATVTDVPGGTRFVMTCRYTGPVEVTGDPAEYNLRYVPKGGGTPQWMGSWPVLSKDSYKLDMVLPVTRDKIDKFEVLWKGTAVLSLPMS
jgi:Putative zinc-finger